MNEHVIGVDFGTDSVRSVVVDARTGEPVAQAASGYRRWAEGRYCDPRENRFRQHPRDYIESLEEAVTGALAASPPGTAKSVVGISADTTGSTPGPLDAHGVPLALHPRFDENPNAMFILWKDHTAIEESVEITRAAGSWGGDDYTVYSGGTYSAEWFWSKVLHVTRVDARVGEAAFSWAEHCDWIPALLTGNRDARGFKRSRCAAGHKAMWNESHGGLPCEEFLVGIDGRLAGLRSRLYNDTVTADFPAGTLCAEWAERLGLTSRVVVGAGAIDAHFGAVGAGIEPYVLTKVIGTSTCDMLIAPPGEMKGGPVRGICGQVDGSIVPGMIGMEAGQSAFGDAYAWFAGLLAWGARASGAAKGAVDVERLIERLIADAPDPGRGDSEVLALDWINGRRTPDADQSLKGALTGLSLGTDPPEIFRALVDATAYGARSIVERFVSEGVPIKRVIALGGIPRKAPLVMQTLADVLDMPVEVSASEQACALGAAMFAATASGFYDGVFEAQKAMGPGFDFEYRPSAREVERHRRGYDEYLKLGRAVEDISRARG